MSFSAPPNYVNVALCASLGVSLSLILFTIRSSNLPFSGDQFHSLPHGGSYRDGTKSIGYNSPSGGSPNSYDSLRFPAFCVVISIILILNALHLSRRRGSVFHDCCAAHRNSQQ